MIVIATGPRSNGTSLLHRILDTGIFSTTHMPVCPPILDDWASELPLTLFVVIYRDEMAAAKSIVRRSIRGEIGFNHFSEEAALQELKLARRFLEYQTSRMGTRSLSVAYESLLSHPQAVVDSIDNWLREHGYDGPALRLPEPIRDENAKWQGAA